MFKVSKERVYFEESVVRLFPVLGKAENRKLVTCVLLAVYYGSPYARYPENERWSLAKKKVYGSSDFPLQEDKSFEEVKQLIEGFQYDERRETIRNYLQKIHLLNSRLLEEKDEKKIGTIDDAIERLTGRVKKMEEEMSMEEDAVALKGGGRLSYLEKWQDRMREMNKKLKEQKERTGIEFITEHIP